MYYGLLQMTGKTKKVTLIIGAIVLGIIVAVFAMRHYRNAQLLYEANMKLRDELRAEVDAWLASLPKLPPDEENGALIVLQGLEKTKWCEHLDEYVRRVQDKDADAVRDFLAENDEAFRLIQKGLAYKRRLYPIDNSRALDTKLLPIGEIVLAAKVLTVKGNLAAFEGRKLETLKDYLDVLRLGAMHSSGRNMVVRLLEAAVYGIVFDSLVSALSELPLSAKDLETTLGQLKELYQKRGDFAAVFEDEYHFFILTIADLLDDRKQPGEFSEEQAEALRRLPDYDWRKEVEAYKKFLEIIGNADPAEYFAIPTESTQERMEFYRAEIGHSPRETKTILATLMIPSVAGLHKEFAELETKWRGAIVLTALRVFEKRNGRRPKRLSELGDLVPKELLTDPCSGKYLVYRRQDEDFLLYSVGLDKADNGGEDSDLVFHTSRPK